MHDLRNDPPKLRAQNVGLEQRTSRAARDTGEYAPGAGDDMANAATGALVLAQPRSTGRCLHHGEKDGARTSRRLRDTARVESSTAS
jgi:hypothetical protein